jgi:hypothetical protein
VLLVPVGAPAAGLADLEGAQPEVVLVLVGVFEQRDILHQVSLTTDRRRVP